MDNIKLNPVINNIIEVIIILSKEKMYPKEWRKGQYIFNSLYLFFPNQVNKLRGTVYDCFHQDDKIEIFILALKELLNETD